VSFSAELRIPADHASLPGHFPGSPVVPGVVLLDQVVQATESHLGYGLEIVGLPQVKFPASLLPEESATVVVEFQGTRLRFQIVARDDARVIAQGIFALAREVRS